MNPICTVDGVLGRNAHGHTGICSYIKCGGSECGHKGTCEHQLPDVHLNLKAGYFQQIRDDEKPEEYRLNTDYWNKRLIGKTFGRVIVKNGYPKADDTDRISCRRWKGCTVKTITHEEFGEQPVEVIAIDVSEAMP